MNNYTVLLTLTGLTLYTSSATAQIMQLNDLQEYKNLIKEKTPMVIQFAADWCGVCQKVKQPFEQVADEPEFKHITFARMNIDTLGQTGAQENNIVGVPTFVYRSHGAKKDESIGVQNMDGFKDEIRENLRASLPEETVEQIQQGMPSIESKEAPPVQEKPTPAPAGGFLQKIKDFFFLLIKKTAEFIKMILDYIKGLFGR